MKKILIPFFILLASFVTNEARADIYFYKYTPIQYNVRLSTGEYYGIAAGATISYSGTFSGATTYADIYPHIAWPSVFVGGSGTPYPNFATYTMIVPPMTTPFKVS